MTPFVRSLAVFSALPLAALTAQPTRPAARTNRPAESLPLRRVALYKNGVGFFEHVAEVNGTARVSVNFTTAQLNDVLQTLTVVDLGGGRVTGAEYNSATPIDQQIRNLSLPLGEAATAADVYTALRGQRVEVTGQGAPLTGRLLNVQVEEGRPEDEDKPRARPRHLLTVVSDGGTVRTVELTGRTAVRVLDPAVEATMNQYLQLLSIQQVAGCVT